MDAVKRYECICCDAIYDERSDAETCCATVNEVWACVSCGLNLYSKALADQCCTDPKTTGDE